MKVATVEAFGVFVCVLRAVSDRVVYWTLCWPAWLKQGHENDR